MGSDWGRRFRDTTTLLDYGFAAAINARSVYLIGSSVLVGDSEIEFNAYQIGGRNYFRIRDLAYALNGTTAQFSVAWNRELRAVILTSGMPYTAIGDELMADDGERKLPRESEARVIFDGRELDISGYFIDGSLFFGIRDILGPLDASVTWDPEEGRIAIAGFSQLNLGSEQ